ncbi:hypothetical protein PoB_006234700 [Plakobranchus ocellatus]|uniref:Uncharacterized protein n=1 Tax=Plakobranchus ocellatus TaxID=259542 RepID=A0AAV4CVA9_9GAST|nr:hypothetical protein PoB_006234700 [Plakobranchus ocellatus]
MTLPDKDSRIKLAAARNTLESLWRPPETLWGRLAAANSTSESAWRPPDCLCLRDNDSSPREDNCKQTNKQTKKTVIDFGGGKWLSLLINLKISFKRKYIHLRDMSGFGVKRVRLAGAELRYIDSRVLLAAANLTLDSVWRESHSGVLHRLKWRHNKDRLQQYVNRKVCLSNRRQRISYSHQEVGSNPGAKEMLGRISRERAYRIRITTGNFELIYPEWNKYLKIIQNTGIRS